jgi:hypothetical protein
MEAVSSRDNRVCAVIANSEPTVLHLHTMATSKRTKSPMSDEHKAALAEGRNQGRAVRRYLEALDENRPKRGRKRTEESVARDLARTEEELATADALRRLELIQRRLDLQVELEKMGTTVDLSALEAEFVAVAKGYAERKQISYEAWREAGVSASTLKAAGITRGTV